MRRSRWIQSGSTAVALLVVGVLWGLLAPIQVGGPVAYAIIIGNSMLPRHHRGDLVLLRRASTYQVGDVAAYRDPRVGVVVHRIIRLEGDRFVLQGDHNSFVDPYHPTQAELIGKEWIHIPSIGQYVETLRTPRNLTILVGVVGAIAMTVITDTNPRQAGKQRQTTGAPLGLSWQISRNLVDLFLVLGFLAAGSLILAVAAFTRSAMRTVPREIQYEHAGMFGYSASVPPGIYDSDTVQTGEPVFRRLTDLVAVRFEYRLLAGTPITVAGTRRLIAELSDGSGWKRTVELQPETPFTGGAFSAAGLINLSEIQALIDTLEEQAGLRRGQYTLSIQPQVVVHGDVAGQTLHDRFAPTLAFRLSELEVQLADAPEALVPSQRGAITYSMTEPNTLSLLGLTIQVLFARQVSVIGLAISLGGLQVLALVAFQTRYGGEASRIQARYSPLLISVHNEIWRNIRPPLIEVNTIDDLAKIAERNNNGVILHRAHGTEHDYFVQNAEATYHYRVRDGQATFRGARANDDSQTFLPGYDRVVVAGDGEYNYGVCRSQHSAAIQRGG